MKNIIKATEIVVKAPGGRVIRCWESAEIELKTGTLSDYRTTIEWDAEATFAEGFAQHPEVSPDEKYEATLELRGTVATGCSPQEVADDFNAKNKSYKLVLKK